MVMLQVSDANFSHVPSAAKVISSAADDQKQIIAVVERSPWGEEEGGLTDIEFALFLFCPILGPVPPNMEQQAMYLVS